MSESSTTNLLQGTNRVLRDIGERAVLNLSSPVALKASSYLQDSVRELMSEHDWEWTRDRIAASSWTNERADLGDTQRITDVQYGSQSLGYWPVYWVDNVDFDSRVLTSFSDTSGERPRWWTNSTYNIVRLNPYPTGSTGQGNVVFYIVRDLTPPVNTTDLFPVPERYMVCLYKKAAGEMALKHLDDPGLAQMYLRDYQELITRFRQRERSVPASGFNMFRSMKRGRRFV